MEPIPRESFEGKYEILEKIRELGLGAAYRVRHRLLEEIRVIEVIRSRFRGNDASRARFLREARNAIRLRHANIAQVYDFTIDDEGNALIVREYVEGVTLDELLRRSGPAPLPLALEISSQALEAIGYLHRKKMIHRDIAPDSLMLARDAGGGVLVKLIDLGLARGHEDESGATPEGRRPCYASPEHFRAAEGVEPDERSDIFSFGVVLCELLTGVSPAGGDGGPAGTAGRRLAASLSAAGSEAGGRIPEALRAAVLRALAEQPEERFQTARSFADALAAIGPGDPLSPSELDGLFGEPTARAARPPGRNSSRQPLDHCAALDAVAAPSAARKPARSAELSKADRVLAEIEASLASRKKRGSTPPPASVDIGAQTPAVAVGRAQATVEAEPAGALRRVEALLGERDVAGARAALTDARTAGTGDAELAQLAAEIEEAAEAESGRRRAEALGEARRRIEAALVAGDGDEAGRALAVAEKLFPGDEDLLALRVRLAELEARLRAARIAPLLDSAAAAAASGELERSIVLLEDALIVDPANEVLRDRLHGLRRRQALAVVQACIDRGDSDGAESALRLAERLFGADLDSAAVRRRLEELRSAIA